MALDPNPGLTVVEIVHAILAGRIKGMYIMGENPAMSDPDLNHAREAMARLEHLVVQEIFLTETAGVRRRHPAGDGLPREDRHVHEHRPPRPARPAGPARRPARPGRTGRSSRSSRVRLGLDWAYRHPRDVFDEMRTVMPSLHGITWERLEREGAVTYPCDGEDQPGQEVIFGDGFPTPSGRGQARPRRAGPAGRGARREFPMILTTGRLLEHWHTGAMTRRASVLDALEPEAVALLSPRELRRLGLGPGELVRVTTRRGTIELAARADRDVPEGMIFIPFCFAEAAANLLTNPALDPFGKIPEFKFCAAKLEKADK